MQNKNTFLIVGVGLVAAIVAAALMYYVFTREDGENPTGAENLVGEEVSEEADETKMPAASGDEENSNEPSVATVADPTIPISPYTVYIGFASQVGETSTIAAQETSLTVIGYEWEALPRSQMFSSVVLPEWESSGEDRYEVFVWEDNVYVSLGFFAAGEKVEFPREGFAGATRFKVTGVDPRLKICPGDRTFNWESRFTFEGELGLVRTPITEDLKGGMLCEMR